MDKKILIFIASVLLTSWLTVIAISHFGWGESPMTIVMVIPMILALIFILFSKKDKLRDVGWRFPGLKYLFISIFLPILQVLIIVGIGIAFNKLTFNSEYILNRTPTSSLSLNLILSLPALFIPFIMLSLPAFIMGWINHLGEELAWRGYLLRDIYKSRGSINKALIISGAVWWAWHLPMFWMSPVLSELALMKMGMTIILSFFALLGTTVVYAWVYLESGSIWAPAIMHIVWNLYRAVFTGRLSNGGQGLFKGDLWLINGEGVIGCLVMAFFGVLFYIIIRKKR